MKTYTQEEVIILLRKASWDIDRSLILGIFNTVDEAMPYWIKANLQDNGVTIKDLTSNNNK